MKFQPDHHEGVNAITRHEPGRIWVGSESFDHSLLLPWTGTPQPWSPSVPAELQAGHFEAIVALKPQLVVFGSGLKLRFVRPELLRALIDRRIGVETMDTAAACRTYNVLASEGRAVVAALLVEPSPRRE
jgi:uncharacterized protein